MIFFLFSQPFCCSFIPWFGFLHFDLVLNSISKPHAFFISLNSFGILGFLIDCERLMTLCIGNLDSRVTEKDVEDEFHVFGVIRK
ncbi:hypothetical protein D0Y65_014045 [Glycine soja]|uniref:Uncharacterized protein n=1 Tax=Glycine soja TaxID=3848 RepID=A0A445K679_GLYSO|nr:hypothetical protein D0Y65_014045 [Glycine soja]